MKINQTLLAVLYCVLLSLLESCAAVGVGLFYKKARLPESQIVRDVQYANALGTDPTMNRLDLFVPQGTDWPVMVFVHGGSWSEGDKDLTIAGADVYGNIGRHFAAQGIGTAVISYRLMPHVDWETQVVDVAKATGWVYQHIHEYQGNPRRIFVMGHSAGAQLASRMALDSSALNNIGLSPRLVCGVIAISGVGYNFLDEEIYQLGKDEGVYRTLFNQEDLSLKMRKKLSPVFFAKRSSPPFLILYAARDQPEIRRSSQDLARWLDNVGTHNQLYSIARESHKSTVLALSRANTAADVISVFIKTMHCVE